ncbi:serendipity locus protein alpha-like [Battus philenor]|uniref:serendipity locus protein alpha-like n=1 Tax=Battus philenor TaxID=42288 RepID=UPI0035CEE1A4
MDDKILNLYQELPENIQLATKLVLETFIVKLYPLLNKLNCNIVTLLKNDQFQEDVNKINSLFRLCISQINKCYLLLFDIFNLEQEKKVLLLESRESTLERLSWCCNRVVAIKKSLEELQSENRHNNCFDDSIYATPLHFVNWIDQAFDNLKKLIILFSNVNKDPEELCDGWKNEVIDCLGTLHTSIDELLLSAMTLCRYCLPNDQHVIKVRCQVVLREKNSLFTEVVDGDINIEFDATLSLKTPIKPTNVNVLIHVLKDSLYMLETNTNTALLALLVHCFSHYTSPVDILKAHYDRNKGMCQCLSKSEDDTTETCNFVKEFDLHNERLLQIASFAISCSSDQKRVIGIRSNLATLEALDSRLVPALIVAPESHHSILLKNTWDKEVLEIRDSVFLIVDPSAFSGKAKQMMHQMLLEVIKENAYDNGKICYIINIACLVFDFFDVYNKHEPDAINEREKMLPLMADLKKVQSECKVVSDLLSSGDDFVYNFKKSDSAKNITFEQILKRIKLLYTIIKRINMLQQPKDEDFFENVDVLITGDYQTHTVCTRNNETYIKSPRSIFARTINLNTPTNNIPLFKLTRHLKTKKDNASSFLAQFNDLCNADLKLGSCQNSKTFFYSPLKKRQSIRKSVLKQHKLIETDEFENNMKYGIDNNIFDESLSLQISEVLNQIKDLTTTFSGRQCLTSKFCKENRQEELMDTPNINNGNSTIRKQVWGFPISDKIDPDISFLTTDVSQPSNVTTLERLNDLNFVESKLSDLRVMRFETSL